MVNSRSLCYFKVILDFNWFRENWLGMSRIDDCFGWEHVGRLFWEMGGVSIVWRRLSFMGGGVVAGKGRKEDLGLVVEEKWFWGWLGI